MLSTVTTYPSKLLAFGLVLGLSTLSIQHTWAQALYPHRNDAEKPEMRGMEHVDVKTTLSELNKDLRQAKSKRQATLPIEAAIKRVEKANSMLAATDQVLIVDSLVVSKNELLKAYLLTPQNGSLTTTDGGKTVCYTTERGNTRFRSITADDSLHTLTLMREDKDGSSFGPPQPLRGIGIDGETNYPFLMPDGITLYLSARSPEGLGNYDLFVTRYDSERQTFYPAENLGYPYNSTANDYMMAIDEENNIGWFASDRFQPTDSVCIYTFVPNASRKPIDETLFHSTKLKAIALACPIAATWNDENANERIRVKQTLARLDVSQKTIQKHDFEFVINDIHTYTSLSDFQSAQAKELFNEWLTKSKQVKTSKQELDDLRRQYHTANKQKRQSLAPNILQLEKQCEQMQSDLYELEKRIRKTELSKGL